MIYIFKRDTIDHIHKLLCRTSCGHLNGGCVITSDMSKSTTHVASQINSLYIYHLEVYGLWIISSELFELFRTNKYLWDYNALFTGKEGEYFYWTVVDHDKSCWSLFIIPACCQVIGISFFYVHIFWINTLNNFAKIIHFLPIYDHSLSSPFSILYLLLN
jgi:hypothetical protein